MKKQILAVAVAGAFAVPAFAAADSNVTLFGQLQTQIVHHSGGPDGFDSGFRMQDAGAAGWASDGNGPNRIGFLANHDLGNGLTGLLKIEQDVRTTEGIGQNGRARDVYVGIDGDFGRVTAGRMSMPYSTAGKDPLNGTFMQARAGGGRLGPADFGGLGNGSYLDRVLAYSNSFGMVSLNVAAAIDNADDSNTALSGRLNFDIGPVDLYVAHTNADDYSPAGLVNTDFRASKIGADWKSGPFRVVGEVEDFKVDPAGAGDFKGNTYFVSGVYTMGRNDFVLSLGHTNLDGSNNNTDFAAIAVKHNFTNRVMAFAGVSYSSFDENAGLTGAPAAPANNGLVDDYSFTGVGGGLRVSF
ncbi:porin [Thioalkalivibrio sp. ALE9]|uniref:porin n=1 Tax=Thioalkalivibrio sp. ALE9 TaxID=1158169 RepID=UPI00036F52FA|nr:porin [Thioalkalivibrio sp. ALE9]